MTPQVGWNVQYVPAPHSELARGPAFQRMPSPRLAAIIIGVNEDKTIDLFVFGRVGSVACRRNVPFIQDTGDSNVNVIVGYAVPIP